MGVKAHAARAWKGKKNLEEPPPAPKLEMEAQLAGFGGVGVLHWSAGELPAFTRIRTHYKARNPRTPHAATATT